MNNIKFVQEQIISFLFISDACFRCFVYISIQKMSTIDLVSNPAKTSKVDFNPTIRATSNKSLNLSHMSDLTFISLAVLDSDNAFLS